MLATDKNPAAVKNAKQNSSFLDLRIDVRRADVFGSVKKKFDVIVFNPPFIDHEVKQPHEISFWDKGNEAVREFFQGLAGYLKPCGRAFMCWSSFGNTLKFKRIAKEHGFLPLEVGRRKGKNGFIYYAYNIKPKS